MDEPNYRSSHIIPTPKSGGIAFGFAVFLSWVGCWYIVYELRAFGFDSVDLRGGLDGPSVTLYLVKLMICALIMGGVGLVDDRSQLSPLLRMVFQVSLSVLILTGLPFLPVVDGFRWLPSIFTLVLLVVAMVWFINLFNFMDGIDGIATIEAVTILIGIMLLVIVYGKNALILAVVIVPVIAALLAFLWWNWAPAKIFMGDAGSGFLGVLLPGLMFFASWLADISLLSIVILSGVFVVDATVTLIRRIGDGQSFVKAHRSHAYQILARRWLSHSTVSFRVAAINLVWLTPMAAISLVYGGLLYNWGILVIAWAPLVIITFLCRAGLNNN